MANSAFFWKLIHKSYVRSPVGNEEVYQEKLRLTQERLKSNWTLLEVGCGSGNTALTHAPFVSHVTATDFCTEMMDHGRQRAANEGITNIDFIAARFEDLDATQNCDAVLMLSVLHLIPDWRAAIAKAASLTKSGGIFVSSTATLKDQTMMMRIVGHVVNALPLLPSLQLISQDELAREMEKNGFTLEVNWRPEGGDSTFIIARKV